MTPERLALAEAAIATARAVTAHMTMDADARRILGIPDGVDTVEHLQRVAHALADALSPLAPWPPGWVVVPEEEIVAYQWDDTTGACRASVCPDESDAWWRARAPRGTGRSANVLTAVADCMAWLAAHPDSERAAADPDGGGT